MRSDMTKVIIERPRAGGRIKTQKGEKEIRKRRPEAVKLGLFESS